MVSLADRLLGYLAREADGERRTHADLRALPVDARVLEGECLRGAVYLGTESGGAWVFELAENDSKFRSGDAVLVGDGADFEQTLGLAYGDYDAERRRLTLRKDRFARGEGIALQRDQEYCIDRRPLQGRRQLEDIVRAGFADELVAKALQGECKPAFDEDRRARAVERLSERGLNETQIEAGASAVACEQLALVQGPPGTGKTRLLAEVVAALCSAGCRVALSAFTHRAVDNALLALRELDADLPLVKLGYPSAGDAALRSARVSVVDPRRASHLPARGVVVAGTCFALAKLPSGRSFHYAVIDEAGQLPIPHAIAAMLLASRWILFGDHRQLSPVVTQDHVDSEITCSVFEHLERLYGSQMLDVTYRMNSSLCSVIRQTFYGGALRSAPEVADRRIPFVEGGTFDEVLDPDLGAVLARVDHLQPGKRSLEEAGLVADLVVELIQRHGVPASDIAVVAPFRSQVRAIRSALQRTPGDLTAELIVDTVERMQGQEREVVLVSLAVGDPDSLNARAAFFFSVNRLNVAMSRARTKVVVVASSGAFAALPDDPIYLKAANSFRKLQRSLPQIDMTPVYASASRG